MSLLMAPTERLTRWADTHFGFTLLAAQRTEAPLMLAERAAALHLPSVPDYLDALESGKLGRAEADRLAERLTVGETFFFRHPEQIRALIQVALPDRQAARGPLPVQILSAGCATGEEPYTVALAARDAGFTAPFPRITGVDLNPGFLTRARAGRYGRWSLRALPDADAMRDFTPSGELHALEPGTVGRVTFASGNMADPHDPIFHAQSWDIILCRNVLIYFAPARVAEVIARFAHALVPGGWLILGPAETARGLTDLLELREANGAFLYRRRAAEGGRPRTGTGPLVAPAASLLPTIPVLPMIRSLVERECYAEAERQLSRAPAAEATSAEGQLLAGLCRLGVGDFQAAEAIGRTLAAGHACAAEGCHLAGLAREAEASRASDPEAARRAAQAWHTQAVALDPGLATAHGRLGHLARQARLPAGDHFGRALGSLDAEPAERLALFAGGFGRATLRALWLAELGRRNDG